MIVKELIKKLLDYNLDAEVNAIVYFREYEFSLTCSNGDGSKKSDCKTVGFYVDELCTNEREKEKK